MPVWPEKDKETINHDGLIIKEKVMGYMSVVNNVVIL
jgi:hypothetical protein